MVPNLKTDRVEDAPRARESSEAASSSLKAADRNRAAVESPARRLQLNLERSWSEPEPAKRWSARRSLGFILLTNALLWVTLIVGVTKLV